MFDPRDIDELTDHHPPCRGGCGELADECMCNWQPPVIDGRDPAGIEHLCIKDLQIHDGPVEECCETEWREERAALG